MSGMKEIRNKIKSVQNTRKITKAMEMVAASKMRKAQDRMRAARPYADKVRNICANLSKANPEYRHEYMVARDTIKNVAAIVVTTDKGLCGGLNTNVLRLVTNKFQEFEAKGAKVRATAVGSKGVGFFNRIGVEVTSKVVQMGDAPNLESLIGAIKVQLDAYVAGEVDAVYLAYTRFVNTMKQEAVFEQLLPLGGDRLQADEGSMSWDYLYEPDAKAVIDQLLLRYIEALVYQAVAENMASEQSARMVAMKAASDNAKNVINELQLTYNKARQAAITKELAEIVGGAAAV
ncbi:F0F1 ATP synthase subunit gamma [Limnobacter sp.]|uniref:F0F1 ATP synthase subunit gamma n=1 Tax=Limnobacter sp. TaxID=2003368 RepID=UPI003517B780